MTTHGVDGMISKYGVEMRVWGSAPSRSKKRRTRLKGGREFEVLYKLDEVQVRWIIARKRRGENTSGELAGMMGVSARWINGLYARYKNTPRDKITYPPRMGRPRSGLPGRREHAAALFACSRRFMAVRLEDIVGESIGIHITHHVIHRILKDEELAENQPAKARQRKWVRYERRYSNSLWHTDYKRLPDGRWFIAYLDDASRFIVGFGVFDEETTDHAIEVLERAVKRHGSPAQMLTDHGSQFYSNEKECMRRGVSRFETKLVEMGIRQVLARIKHPQTNGKLERFHSDIERHLKSFEDESAANTVRGSRPGDHVGNPFYAAGTTDPISRLVEWHNTSPHMSLKDGMETPAQAYVRKQPPEDITTEAMEESTHGKY